MRNSRPFIGISKFRSEKRIDDNDNEKKWNNVIQDIGINLLHTPGTGRRTNESKKNSKPRTAQVDNPMLHIMICCREAPEA